MVSEAANIPVLILTGPVGVGKSAVAEEIARLLGGLGAAYAIVDMDWLRCCYPSPERDPFHIALGIHNLANVWTNYRTAGAERLVIADVVETRASIADYEDAIPGADIVVVRLNASLVTILRRLEGREEGAGLDWHQQRAAELVAQMDERKVEDVLIQTEGKTVAEVAREVLAQIGWADFQKRERD